MDSVFVNIVAMVMTACYSAILYGLFKHICRGTGLEHWNECYGVNRKTVATIITISVLYFMILGVTSYFGVVDFSEQIARLLLTAITIFVCDLALRLLAHNTMSEGAAVLSGVITFLLLIVCIVIALMELIQLRPVDFLIATISGILITSVCNLYMIEIVL